MIIKFNIKAFHSTDSQSENALLRCSIVQGGAHKSRVNEVSRQRVNIQHNVTQDNSFFQGKKGYLGRI